MLNEDNTVFIIEEFFTPEDVTIDEPNMTTYVNPLGELACHLNSRVQVALQRDSETTYFRVTMCHEDEDVAQWSFAIDGLKYHDWWAQYAYAYNADEGKE